MIRNLHPWIGALPLAMVGQIARRLKSSTITPQVITAIGSAALTLAAGVPLMQRDISDLRAAVAGHEQHMQQMAQSLASAQELLRGLEKRIDIHRRDLDLCRGELWNLKQGKP